MNMWETFFSAGNLAELGPGPRRGVRSEDEVRREVAGWPGADGRSGEALLALALLWHDHHEPAHELAQANEDADGNYVHAILHRREPDYWNAKYWFRRVGAHPAQGPLVNLVQAHLATGGRGQASSRWVSGGKWDPLAFVDACEAVAARGEESADAVLLREVQRLEFIALAGWLADRG